MLRYRKQLQQLLEQIKNEGAYKEERIIVSEQGPEVELSNQQKLLNFCSNNYLGLSTHPRLKTAAIRALQTHGLGLSSVRFICGTQNIHKTLEAMLSEFLGMEDTILYAAAFDANGGLFEPLFDEEDVIISDALNHASIIDGIRLSKATCVRYAHNDMDALEDQLKEHPKAKRRIIVTDGVFSMDGGVAQLDKICDLARKYKALTVVDDCHATGFVGPSGKGTHELHNVMSQVDIITGTLGKALGGASGGFVSGQAEVIDLLRQKSRPYLFSNSLAPPIVGASIEALHLIQESDELRTRLYENTAYFRTQAQKIGYTIPKGTHPIVPIMLYDNFMTQKLANKLLERNIYVVGFSYPVVPRGQARIRVQISATHTKEHIDKLILALEKEGISLGLI